MNRSKTADANGFTLIELLIALSIIALLAGTIFAVSSRIKKSALNQITITRMQQVLTGLSTYRVLDGSATAAFQYYLNLGGVSQFTSLQTVKDQISTSGGTVTDTFPPGIVYDDATLVFTKHYDFVTNLNSNWTGQERMRGSSMLNLISQQVFEAAPPFGSAFPNTWFVTTWPSQWPWTDWDKPVPGSTPPILRFPWGRPGLRLDGSLCNPQTPPATTKIHTERCTVLSNRTTSNATYPKFQQTMTNAWVTCGPPVGGPITWTIESTSGHVTGSASGQTGPVRDPVTATRSNGDAVSVNANAPLPFDLGYCSPLKTIELLQASGVLETGAAGAAAYRSDRNPKAAWNDAWGNPLIVTYALYQPERYIRNYDFMNRRDLLLRSSAKNYRFNRAAYFSVGSLGPSFVGSSDITNLANSTDASSDAPMLREYWLKIREVCQAADWNESSFAHPPWNGIREKSSQGMTCFLSAPIELH